MQNHLTTVLTTSHPAAELDRLGDEIAELSAHLDAATARLLELIRAFGWAIDVLHPLAQGARPCPPSEHGPAAAGPTAIAVGAGPPPILE